MHICKRVDRVSLIKERAKFKKRIKQLSLPKLQGHVFRKVHFISTHPKFNSTTYDNDLALLWFHDPIKFAPNVVPICISEKGMTVEIGWVTGWGQLRKGK